MDNNINNITQSHSISIQTCEETNGADYTDFLRVAKLITGKRKAGHISHKGFSASCNTNKYSLYNFPALITLHLRQCIIEWTGTLATRNTVRCISALKYERYCSWALCVEKPLLCRWFLVINTLLRPTEEITFNHN